MLLGAAFSFDVREIFDDFFFFDVALELILYMLWTRSLQNKSLDGSLFGDTRRKDVPSNKIVGLIFIPFMRRSFSYSITIRIFSYDICYPYGFWQVVQLVLSIAPWKRRFYQIGAAARNFRDEKLLRFLTRHFQRSLCINGNHGV